LRKYQTRISESLEEAEGFFNRRIRRKLILTGVLQLEIAYSSYFPQLLHEPVIITQIAGFNHNGDNLGFHICI
jgi:hypothetical protein